MTFEDAIKESIRKYYDKKHDDESLESNKVAPIKYTKKYFDGFEEEQLGTNIKDTKKVKK